MKFDGRRICLLYREALATARIPEKPAVKFSGQVSFHQSHFSLSQHSSSLENHEDLILVRAHKWKGTIEEAIFTSFVASSSPIYEQCAGQ